MQRSTTAAIALASPGRHTQKQNQAEPASRADRGARPSEVRRCPAPLTRLPMEQAGGGSWWWVGAPLVAGGAGRAVGAYSKEQATAVLWGPSSPPQVADGDGLRERAL